MPQSKFPPRQSHPKTKPVESFPGGEEEILSLSQTEIASQFFASEGLLDGEERGPVDIREEEAFEKESDSRFPRRPASPAPRIDQQVLTEQLKEVFLKFANDRTHAVALGFALFEFVKTVQTEIDFETLTETYHKETSQVAPHPTYCKRLFQTVQYWHEKIGLSQKEIEDIGQSRLFECMSFSKNRADEIQQARSWAEQARRASHQEWRELVASQRGSSTPSGWVKIPIPVSVHEQIKNLSVRLYKELKDRAVGNPSISLPMAPNETTTIEFMARILDNMPVEERIALWSAEHSDETKFEIARRKMMVKNNLSDSDLPPAIFFDSILDAVLESLDGEEA